MKLTLEIPERKKQSSKTISFPQNVFFGQYKYTFDKSAKKFSQIFCCCYCEKNKDLDIFKSF